MRLLVRIALGIGALVAVVVIAFLGPALIQVSRATPRLPPTADLLSLLDDREGPVSLHYVPVASQQLPGDTLGHTVFVARWADDRTFMIDAGMDEAEAADFASLLATLAGGGEASFFGDIAAQLGDAVRSVAGVGLTHLHIDHTQGVIPFCAARGSGAAVYQTSWQAERHNFNTTESAELIRESCLEPRALADHGLARIDGFPGFAAVALGGHTPGSTLFAAALDDHLWLFSGDTTNTKAALLDDVGKGFLYSWVLVPENTTRTGELRRWLAKLDARPDVTVIVSHDLPDIERSGLPRWPANGS